MPSRTKAQRDKHYREYQGKPEQIKKRSQRNKARRKMIKAGKAKVGDGKDVNHKTPISRGGGNSMNNLSVTSRKTNRGYARDSKNKPVAKRKAAPKKKKRR